MKKIVIACFLAIMMLLVPISTVGGAENIRNIRNIINNNVETPEIYLSEEERVFLELYIYENFDGEEEIQANAILDNMLAYNDEYAEDPVYLIDIDKLADALDEYSIIQPIPDEKLTRTYVQTINGLLDLIDDYWAPNESPFNNFVKEIIEIIQPRLGWMYDLFTKGGELFINGVNLAIDFIEQIQILDFALIFAIMFNLIVSVPLLYFSETIRMLFEPNFDGFIERIQNFTSVFTENISQAVNQLEIILEPLGQAFDEIKAYVAQISDFVDWITGEGNYDKSPWEKEIVVKGTAKTLVAGDPYADAEVSCRGVTATTDSQGRFEFTVEPSDDADDSKPANSWYGLHSCRITLSINGEVKRQTHLLLSYVFSDGEIEWSFRVVKSRSRFLELQKNIIERFSILLERINSLLPILFKNINIAI